MYFRFGNTSQNKSKKNRISFLSWPMRATLFWGPMFPLEKTWFADSAMSMSGSEARDHFARTCRPFWVFPCCDDLHLGKYLWGICDVRLTTCCVE